jgi:hypothetical protein
MYAMYACPWFNKLLYSLIIYQTILYLLSTFSQRIRNTLFITNGIEDSVIPAKRLVRFSARYVFRNLVRVFSMIMTNARILSIYLRLIIGERLMIDGLIVIVLEGLTRCSYGFVYADSLLRWKYPFYSSLMISLPLVTYITIDLYSLTLFFRLS